MLAEAQFIKKDATTTSHTSDAWLYCPHAHHVYCLVHQDRRIEEMLVEIKEAQKDVERLRNNKSLTQVGRVALVRVTLHTGSASHSFT